MSQEESISKAVAFQFLWLSTLEPDRPAPRKAAASAIVIPLGASGFDLIEHNKLSSGMVANSRMATAVQALCVMVYVGPDGMTSEVIARSLGTNAVVVRRLMKDLERGGLVRLRPGKDGGVRLAQDPADITLEAVGRAIEGKDGVFALRQGGNAACRVNRNMVRLLSPIFAAVDSAVASTLAQTTIADLTIQIPPRRAQ